MENALSSGGGILLHILMILVSGLIIGGLARWIMPGPDPMSIGKTILWGIAGSIVGGLVAALFRLSPTLHPFLDLPAGSRRRVARAVGRQTLQTKRTVAILPQLFNTHAIYRK
ncbi:MAG TPA: hypothetical protein VF783_17270 [Terriglobales bacterium]